MYFPVFALVFIFWNRENGKRAFRKGVIFIVLVLLLMIPWTIRNYQVFGKVIILTKRVHMTEIILNKFSDNRLYHETINSKHYLRPSQVDSIAKGWATFGRDPVEIERIKRGIIPHRNTIWQRWSCELFEFLTPCRFSPGYSGDGYRFRYRSLRHNLSLLFSYGALLPFFLIGVFFALIKRSKYAIFLLLIISYHVWAHVFLLWAVYRYRVPIDVFIILFAAYGFQLAFSFVRQKQVAIGTQVAYQRHQIIPDGVSVNIR